MTDEETDDYLHDSVHLQMPTVRPFGPEAPSGRTASNSAASRF